MKRTRYAVAGALLALVLAGVGWAALAPVHYPNRDQLFDIPAGTFKRKMAHQTVETLPPTIRLALGVKDVLVLKNDDDVPHIFGPTLIMPGQSFRLPFSTVSENSFTCTAHANRQLEVIVEPTPDTPWRRLRWRTMRLLERIAYSGLVIQAEKLLHS